MTFRIIRGALVGIILGLLVGVSLSGAMYMYSYMEQGIKADKGQQLVAENSLEDKTLEADGESNIQVVVDKEKLQDNFDYQGFRSILDNQGITGVARNVAAAYGRVENINDEDSLSELSSTQEEVITTSGQVYKEDSDANTKHPINQQPEEMGDSLGDNLLRLHVRAHSDSQVDIELKYKVRDKVLEAMEEDMSHCKTKEEAVDYVIDNLDYIEEISVDALREENYGYPVKAYVTKDYFPIRQYGDMVLPAGYYDALRIDIGMAEGENFWCLLYPTMCIPEEAGAVITKEGKEEIREELSEEQYEKLFVEQQVPEEKIEIRFKFIEWLFD